MYSSCKLYDAYTSESFWQNSTRNSVQKRSQDSSRSRFQRVLLGSGIYATRKTSEACVLVNDKVPDGNESEIFSVFTPYC